MTIGDDEIMSDRYHFISTWQLTHVGGSKSSIERLSRSTIAYLSTAKFRGLGFAGLDDGINPRS